MSLGDIRSITIDLGAYSKESAQDNGGPYS